MNAALADVLSQYEDAQTPDGRCDRAKWLSFRARNQTGVGPVMVQLQRSAQCLVDQSAAVPRFFGLTFLRSQDPSAATIDPLVLPQTMAGNRYLQG